MRIALLQLNAAPSCPEANGRAIEKAYIESIARGADLAVAPEMAVPGRLHLDRQSDASLMSRVEEENRRLQALSRIVPLIFGTCCLENRGIIQKELWCCERGLLRAKARGNTGAWYTDHSGCPRFEPGDGTHMLFDFFGGKIGLMLGEAHQTLLEELSGIGVSLIINVVASPCALASFAPDGRIPSWGLPSVKAARRAFLTNCSQTYSVPIAHVNAIGAEGPVMFDGGSCLVFPDGTIQCADDFQGGVTIVDTETKGHSLSCGAEYSEGAWLRKALAMGIRDNLSKQGLESVVVGLSGGIDSAVVAALAAEAAAPEKVLGVALPTRFTSAESRELAEGQAWTLGIKYLELDADAPFSATSSSLQRAFPDRRFSLTDENLQSRCRGALLMALTTEPDAHRLLDSDRCVVLCTGNKSEAATGYFTMHGDAIGAFSVLGDLLKTRVYTLAREFECAIPKKVLTRPPTAELRPGQTDESSLLPYRWLDAILGALLEAGRPVECLHDDLGEVLDGYDLDGARIAIPRVLMLMENSRFKRRHLPFALNVTHGAFGSAYSFPFM